MFSKNRIIKLLILFFLLLNLAGLMVAGKGGGKSNKISEFTLNLFSPVEEVFSGITGSISSVWMEYFNLVNVSQENSLLKKRLNEFKAKETLYYEAYRENKRLRNLVNFREKIETEFIAAEVTGRDSSKWFNTIVVSRGSESGVKVNFPVIVHQGIVGQVIEVAKNYSKVLLITDRLSGVDCLVQESRVRGIVSGTGENLCDLKYFLRKFVVKPGDHIITSGMGNVFPKGLRVGKIVDVEKKESGIFQAVKVEPFVDFEKLEEVLILFNNLNTKEK